MLIIIINIDIMRLAISNAKARAKDTEITIIFVQTDDTVFIIKEII